MLIRAGQRAKEEKEHAVIVHERFCEIRNKLHFLNGLKKSVWNRMALRSSRGPGAKLSGMWFECANSNHGQALIFPQYKLST